MRPGRAEGFTLLEVLVALLVIALGLLGMAALQASSLGNTTGARAESLVTEEARSLADLIAANPGYWKAGAFPTGAFTVTGAASGTTISDSTLNGLGTDCASTACTPQQLAAYDLKQWGANLYGQFPGASATISCQTAAPESCSITVNWTMKSAAAVNAATRATAATTARSYTLIETL